ncbi:MAG: hypothetical protein EBS05_00545 [Proteobacteria bacterium]|nr:hypothetical protein [Pseudomonadota bacterium]
MKIRHPAVKTSFFKLVGTYEVDLVLGPELDFTLRLELFKDTERKGWFRAHAWEMECFNLEPTFPVKKNGKALLKKSTESILLERTTQLAGSYQHFKAASEPDALAKVVGDLKGRLAHWTQVKPK